jgi:hypothetical protein
LSPFVNKAMADVATGVVTWKTPLEFQCTSKSKSFTVLLCEWWYIEVIHLDLLL